MKRKTTGAVLVRILKRGIYSYTQARSHNGYVRAKLITPTRRTTVSMGARALTVSARDPAMAAGIPGR